MDIQAFISYLSLEKNYSNHTVLAYRKDLEEFSIFCSLSYDSLDIDQIDYVVIRSWLVRLSESGITNRSINRKIASLKSYYRFLQKIGEIMVNPLAKHKALKTSKKIEIPFSEVEMDAVLSNIIYSDDFEGKRDQLIINLLYATGMRRAELINLKLLDIDFESNSIKVLGKRNKERLIPMLAGLKPYFLDYYRERLNIVGVRTVE
jgi:integrase/recombinase XerC